MRDRLSKWWLSFVRLSEGSRPLRAKPLREATAEMPSSDDDALDDVTHDDPDLKPVRPPANRALLSRVFDSAHPVRTRAELMGREDELAELLSAALDFHQHVIVHGARGSGKTSLVRIFGDHADQHGAIVIYMACEPGVDFAGLILPYLRALPASAFHPGRRDAFARDLQEMGFQVGPRAVVELLAEHVAAPVLFIFDEFDRITDPAVKSDIAAAMKLLSDAMSGVLFVLVGIARDVSDVIAGHPSLRRHMRTIAIGRIEPHSVEALISTGAAAGGLDFDAEALALIARVACGSPYHVRMFAHHSALAAVAHGSMMVRQTDVRTGLRTALENWASMNRGDAKTFIKLIEANPHRDRVEAAARRAAVDDRLEAGGSEDDAAGLLSDLMLPEHGEEAGLVFRDSVAPQFLIAVIILAEPTADAARTSLSPELSNAVHL